ncbi:MAG: hypothetical protein V3T67_01350 [Nitrosopumilaceae archaeon]
METKDKFFILGGILGLIIPFVEHVATHNSLDVTSVLEEVLLFGVSIWHYVFLYLVLVVSLLVYVKRLRERINPNSRMFFLVSGVAFGFALISIIAATIQPFINN